LWWLLGPGSRLDEHRSVAYRSPLAWQVPVAEVTVGPVAVAEVVEVVEVEVRPWWMMVDRKHAEEVLAAEPYLVG